MQSDGVKVLLVEDNPSDARLFQISLMDGNHCEVVHEPRLQSALHRLSQEMFDIIFLDLFLPDSFGLEALQVVKMVAPDIPVVVWSGLRDEGAATLALQRGAQDFLPKDHGFKPGVLSRVLHYSIERHRYATFHLSSNHETK